MSKHKSYPHYRINVKDNSIADVIYNEVLPVHRPIYVMRTERGEINKPIWCASYNDAVKQFGRATFDESSKYFSLQALFLKNTFTYNGAFIMRVVDESTAAKAFVILEAHVTTDYDVPQYEVDDDGNRVLSRNLDPNSPNYGMLEYVPRTESVTTTEQGPQYDQYGAVLKDAYGNVIMGDVEVTTDTPITEKGIRIRWRTRLVYGGEEETGLDALKAEVVGTNEVAYPIMAFEALTPGAYGNGLGFSLFYDRAQNSESVVKEYESVFYTIEMGEKGPNDSTISPIILNNSSLLSFASNVDSVNKDTNFSYNMEGILTRAFNSNNKKMPFNIYTYEENLRIIGNLVVQAELNRTVETNGGLHFIDDENYMDFEGISSTASGFVVDPTSSAGYYVNVLSGVNVNGITYDHVIVDKEDESPNAVALQNKSYIYLQSGADGAESGDEGDTYVNEAFKQFLRGQTAEIIDNARYPITHLYDVGFPIAIKLEMIEFLGLRDDVVVELSTQDASRTLNTKSTDEENGQFLRTRALLQMESLERGTDCCRCAIYTQAGTLADGTYNGIVPFTFWSAMMHARYGNGQTMSSKEPRGLPYAVNEYFKSYNWLNFTPTGQAYVWDLGLNYCQAADMTRIFYPSLRTVYRADSSVLTDQWFVDALVYTKHVVRQAWATHVGRNDPSDVLNSSLETYLTNALTALFNGKYTFTVVVTQNEEERRLGYIRHAYIRIVSPATFRVLEVDIEVNRENYNQENEEQ